MSKKALELEKTKSITTSSLELPVSVELPKTKENGAYVLDNAIDKVSSIRVRLDRLIFTLIIVSLFGLMVDPLKIYEIKIWDIGADLSGKILGLIITIALAGIFTLIGSNLIDYIKKRAILEKYAEQLLPEIESNERADILVHASFYEFMYELDILQKELRLPASLILILIFYFSHFVAILQIFNFFGKDSPISYLSVALLLIYFFELYKTFVRSTIKSKKDALGSIMVKLLLASLVVAITVGSIFFFAL